MRAVAVALIGVLQFVASTAAHALPDELEIHLDDTTPKGRFGADVISNYAIQGPRRTDEGLRSTHHLLQVSPDFSYGVTETSQLGLQLFSSFGPGGSARIDGGRLEWMTIPVRPPDADDDGYWIGGLFEIGHLPPTLSNNHLDAEIKILTGMRTGRWLFALSPEMGFKVSGPASSKPELELKLKAAYRADAGFSVGVEQYSELGTLGHLGPLGQLSQQTFAVADFHRNGWDFNVGLGRGWNDASEKWTIKAIVGFPIGD